jgi:WD40 repeat protein
MRVLQGPKQPIERLRFSPNSSGLAAETRYKPLYWPTFDIARPRVFEPCYSNGIDVLADGVHVLLFTKTGLRAYAPDDEDGSRIPGRGFVSSFACSPTEPLVVVRGSQFRWSGWRVGPDGKWDQLWEGKGGGRFRPLFSAGGTRVFQQLQGDYDMTTNTVGDGTVEAYDPRTGAPIEAVPSRGLILYSAVLSPDVRVIATTYMQEIGLFARAPEWEKRGTLRNDNKRHFTGIAFHPSGKYLAATSNDETVKLYDTATWEVARTFTWDVGKMRSIAFSPDGMLAAAGSEKGQVVVWDVDI